MTRNDRAIARRRKLDELAEWFRQEAKSSLTGEILTTEERQEIQQRVRRGRRQQGWCHPIPWKGASF